MTKQETIKLIMIIKASFPFWGSKLSPDELKVTVDIWTEMLGEYDFKVVMSAMKILIATKKDFPPSIAEVIEKVQFLSSGGDTGLSEVEAWSMVRRAIGNGMYGATEEFEKLPKEIQIAIREPATIKNWSQLEPDELDTVVASNFMRSFKEVKKRETEYKALPRDIKTMIEASTHKMIGG